MLEFEIGNRNVNDEGTLNFLQNFIEDLKELLSVYDIQHIYGFDDGSIVLVMPNGVEHDITRMEH